MAILTPHRSNPGADIDAMVTVINQLQAALVALVAKLNADAGVTDTNYAAAVDTIEFTY